MLIVKIISLVSFVMFIFSSIEFIKLFYVWIFGYTFFISLTIMAFHEYIIRSLFKIRDTLSLTISSLLNLEYKFKEKGGLTGYRPIKEKHIAIIFPNINHRNYPNINSKEIKLLIDHYDKIGKKYRLYFCYLVDDFINIVRSQHVIGLHIFGHGGIDHLVFEDGVVYYREFKRVQPKEFVCQWHCNIGKYPDKHLGNIARQYYVPKGYRNYFNNVKDIRKLIKGNLTWTINENF